MSEMDTKTASAHARSYVAKVCKPFEQIEAVLSAALEAESRIGGLQRQGESLEEKIVGLRDQKAALDAAISGLATNQREAVTAAEQDRLRSRS